MEITGGPIDSLIGKRLVYPWMRKIVPLFGNFLLARLILFATLVVQLILELLSDRSVPGFLFSAVCFAAVGAYEYLAKIRPFERGVERCMESGILDTKVVKAAIHICNARMMWGFYIVALTGLLIAMTDVISLPFIYCMLGYPLAGFAATCLHPRRKSKLWARVKAFCAPVPRLIHAYVPG